MRMLQPPDWAPPKGYANGITARGTLVFVGGQVGWNGQQQFASDDFVAQARQALDNVVAVLREAGARPEHIVRMTWYVTDRGEYLAKPARARRSVSRGHRPPLSGDDGGRGQRAHREAGPGGDRGDGGRARLTGSA